MKKQQAKWHLCAGILNEGVYLHSMRDGCYSCAPFWSVYPVCVKHKQKISSAGYCVSCKKYYSLENKPDTRDLIAAYKQNGHEIPTYQE